MANDLPPTMRGYSPFEVVSALQKAVRRSDPDAALYWGAELFKSNYAAWAWKRLRIIMTEDVGPSMDPGTVADIWALKCFAEEGTKKDKAKNTQNEFFYYAHALILLCKSKKTRVADNAFMQHFENHVERREIPDYALDVHTQKGRAAGRDWSYFVEESGRLIDPDKAAQSRGFESMEQELDSLSDGYLDDWLKTRTGQRHELPQNPFRTVASGPGKLNPAKGVKTLFVSRPLGIPMPGESTPENANGEKEDREEKPDGSNA
jgi:replication-associated recombination protein RarA